MKRVRRDFLDTLWNETKAMDESEWKSLARNKLIVFEEELHEAVEAGVVSYSGQRSWTLANAVMFSFTVASTIGEILKKYLKA